MHVLLRTRLRISTDRQVHSHRCARRWAGPLAKPRPPSHHLGEEGPVAPALPHSCSEGAGRAHSVVQVPQGLRQDLSSTWARDSPACTQPLLTCGLGVWAASPWWQPRASAA